MAVVGIAYVVDEMEEYGLNCWGVYDGKNLLTEQDDQGMNVAESIALLTNKLRGIRANTVVVKVSGVSKKNRRGAETFKVRQYVVDIGSSPAPVAGIAPGVDTTEVRELRKQVLELNEKLLKSNYENELGELRREIKELKEGNDESISGIMKSLLPALVPHLVTPQAQPVQTLAGVPGADELLKQWAEVDPDYMAVLSKVVAIAVESPEKYNSYKPLILSS